MSEEKEEKTGFGKLKNQIIAGAGVALTTLGTMFIDEIKTIVGLGDEPQTEQVQSVQNNNQSQNNNQNQSVIINVPQQQVAPQKTVIIKEAPKSQAAPAPVKKKEKEEEAGW
jgi:hypothetical protein